MSDLLFDIQEDWQKEWFDMPSFTNKDMPIYKSFTINFKTRDDFLEFK